ncbi:MAG: hypothetical protein ACRDYY_14930 [Acidimicrobiales bacterium]
MTWMPATPRGRSDWQSRSGSVGQQPLLLTTNTDAVGSDPAGFLPAAGPYDGIGANHQRTGLLNQLLQSSRSQVHQKTRLDRPLSAAVAGYPRTPALRPS